MQAEETSQLKEGSTLISLLFPKINTDIVQKLSARKVRE